MRKQEKPGRSAKSRRKPMPTHCFIDSDEWATFMCSRCHRPFCEECAGREDGLKTFCLECSALEPNGKVEQGKESSSGKSPGKILFGAVAALVLGINLYIIMAGKVDAGQGRRQTPAMTPEISNLVECRHRLEAIASFAEDYMRATGSLPDSVDDLTTLAKSAESLSDPVSHKRYIIENDSKKGFAVFCPTPGMHGLSGLFATIGKPARMNFAK